MLKFKLSIGMRTNGDVSDLERGMIVNLFGYFRNYL